MGVLRHPEFACFLNLLTDQPREVELKETFSAVYNTSLAKQRHETGFETKRQCNTVTRGPLPSAAFYMTFAISLV